MKINDHKKVLISGASFAGLCTAYWMQKLGYHITIVEVADGIKKGGTPVNILGNTIAIVERMGLLEKIMANKLNMESFSFKNKDDMTERLEHHQNTQAKRGNEEYEVERDFLLQLLYDLVADKTTFIFGDSITGLQEEASCIKVTFKNSPPQSFDLVFGCDGIHSAVRKLWFGHETEFSKFLNAYFSISIVNKLLIPEYTTQMYSEPGKTIMLNAYNGKTDICLAFYAEQEISYNYRDEQQMRNIILTQFQDTGWRTSELLEEVNGHTGFYFDKLCQIRMPSWTKGRVALIGDAGYCASPAAGRGGSLAIDGAAALAEAFDKSNGDYKLAFKEYNNSFRTFTEEIQDEVVQFGLDMLVPRTEEAIQKRNKEGFGF